MQQFKIEQSVVTLGAKGGFVQTSGGDKIRYDSGRLEAQGDPTGAGDVFFAAYLVNHVFNRMKILDACQSAARIAARQIEGNFIPHHQLALRSNPLNSAED